MNDTLEDKAVLLALKELQTSINTQNVAMANNLRYVQRIDDRVEKLNQRIDETNQRIGELGQRLERRISETNQRISELKDDLSVMIKMELGGAFGNFALKMDNRLSAIEDRLEDMAK